eukprot:GHRR01026795.1.p1 GENE.GHRR01026795.1~~GHRR01026795.1.p1  ORF type:complete len:116 (-),score=19.32 GHRR01026795.1:1045-1392(-)
MQLSRRMGASIRHRTGRPWLSQKKASATVITVATEAVSVLSTQYRYIYTRQKIYVSRQVFTCTVLQCSSIVTRATPLYMQAASSTWSLLGCHFSRQTPPPAEVCSQTAEKELRQQ